MLSRCGVEFCPATDSLVVNPISQEADRICRHSAEHLAQIPAGARDGIDRFAAAFAVSSIAPVGVECVLNPLCDLLRRRHRSSTAAVPCGGKAGHRELRFLCFLTVFAQVFDERPETLVPVR